MGDLPAVDPALDALDVMPRLLVQLRYLVRRQVRGAVHDLAGEHLGRMRQVAGNADLRTDVRAQHFLGVTVGIERGRRLHDRRDDAFQDLAVEVVLGFEVVIHVRLGQAGLGRDIAGLGGGEALVGEFLAGRAQDQFLVALANGTHGQGSSSCLATSKRDRAW